MQSIAGNSTPYLRHDTLESTNVSAWSYMIFSKVHIFFPRGEAE